MSALVSIIVPVFNCETFIAEAIESALAQTYRTIEVIVVNDGSTDGTLSVLQGFGDQIKVIDQANGGPPKARNAGLAAAKGEYIAFLDADDVWLPGKVAAQVAHLEANPDVGTCYFSWHVWPADADGVFRKPAFSLEPMDAPRVVAEKSGWIYNRLIFDCELLTTTVMIRSSIVRKIGEFNVELWNGDDYDYWIRLSQTAKISCLAPAGALYRVVDGSVSRRARPINDELVVIRSAIDRYGMTDSAGNNIDPAKLHARIDSLIFKFGYLHLRKGSLTTAISAFFENIHREPLRPKIWMHIFEAWIRRLFSSAV